MDTLGPQAYLTCLKRLVPVKFKMKKEAMNLMCSIICEINNNIIKACLSSKNRSKVLDVKLIKLSIQRLIPIEIRDEAYQAGDDEIKKLNTGSIVYTDPKIPIPKPVSLEPSMLKKGLQQLAEASHRNLTLSKDCSAIGCIIQKLAVQIAERSIATIGDKPKLDIDEMRKIVFTIIGDELFVHAEGHAATNVTWYQKDVLDFSLKPIRSDGTAESQEEEPEFLLRYIQKLAKSQYSVSLSKLGSKAVDKILNDVAEKVFKETNKFIEGKVIPNIAVSEFVLYDIISKLLPPVMFKLACSYAQGRVMNYSCGILKYEHKKAVKEVEVVPVEQEEFVIEDVVPDYKRAVRRLMQEYNCRAANGFIPLMNDILNDISGAFADMCSKSAKRNDCILSENDVLTAVNVLLPEGLRTHAFARIVHVGRECPEQKERLMHMLRSIQNAEIYLPDDSEYLSKEDTSLQTKEVSEANLSTESEERVSGKDSISPFPKLPPLRVSTILKHYSLQDTEHYILSPHPSESQEKPNVMEEMPSTLPHSSLDSFMQMQPLVEQDTRQPMGSLQHVANYSMEESGISRTSQNQMPKYDTLSDITEKRSSGNMNDVSSLFERVSPRLSKDLKKCEYKTKSSFEPFSPPNKSSSDVNEDNFRFNTVPSQVSTDSEQNEDKTGPSLDPLTSLSKFPSGVNGSYSTKISRVNTHHSKSDDKFRNINQDQWQNERNNVNEDQKTKQQISGKNSDEKYTPKLYENAQDTKSPDSRLIQTFGKNNISQNQVLQSRYYTNDETQSTTKTDENKESGFFNRLQQASSTMLHPFQDRLRSSQESNIQSYKTGFGIKLKLDDNENQNQNVYQETYKDFSSGSQDKFSENDKSLSDNFKMHSFLDKSKEVPVDTSSRGAIESVIGSSVSQNKTSCSNNITSTHKQDIRSSYNEQSSYVMTNVNKEIMPELEQSKTFFRTNASSSEKIPNLIISGYSYNGVGNTSNSSMDLSRKQVEISSTDTEYMNEDTSVIVKTKIKEIKNDLIFLDINRRIFWNDVRPYEFLM